MQAMRIKLIVSGTVLVAAMVYLASAALTSGWVYYLEVDQFVTQSQYHDQRLRLHGKVAEEGFSTSSAGLHATFNLLGKNQSVPVIYRGTIPDMFQVGRDVVVEGRLDSTGVFQADVLMTKCASKYESNPHAQTEPQS